MHLTYDFTVDGESTPSHFNLEDYVGTTAKTKQPTWYRELSLFLFGKQNKREFLKSYFDDVLRTDRYATHKTAKSCPAFINFFRQSLALKTTADIYIKVKKNKDGYDVNWLVRDTFWTLGFHPEEQIGKLSERCIILKLSGIFTWINSEDTQYQYVDPYIANDVPYRVIPGLIRQPKGFINKLNAPIILPTKEAEYIIPAGTTLMYLQFDKPIRSVKNKDLKEKILEYNHNVFIKEDIKYMIGKK